MTREAVAPSSMPGPVPRAAVPPPAIAAPKTPALPLLIAICIADLVILASLLAIGVARGILF